jgi:exopolyphosphatase / guanosine-5'-triphosphate,3'-diphosphate pyrophosphatase
MRKAIIDLGTNTFNLLVADVNGNQIDVVFTDKIGVAIGMGGINNKCLTEESILRGMEAIGHFLEKTKELAVQTIHTFGTSAMRDAENTDEFVSRVQIRGSNNIRFQRGRIDLSRCSSIV